METILECIVYLLESELRDYLEWCRWEDKDPKDLENQHIYVVAVKAMERYKELEKKGGIK